MDRRHFFTSAGAAAMLAATAPAAGADTLDRTDPVATANAFLAAYKDKDVATYFALLSKANQQQLASLGTDGEASPFYGPVFSSKYFRATEQHGGTFGAHGPVRMDGDKRMLFAYGEVPDDGRITVLVLALENGHWVAEDTDAMAPAELEAFAEAPGL